MWPKTSCIQSSAAGRHIPCLDPCCGGENEKTTWDVVIWKVGGEKVELGNKWCNWETVKWDFERRWLPGIPSGGGRWASQWWKCRGQPCGRQEPVGPSWGCWKNQDLSPEDNCYNNRQVHVVLIHLFKQWCVDMSYTHHCSRLWIQDVVEILFAARKQLKDGLGCCHDQGEI